MGLQVLLGALAQHLGSYAELGRAAAVEYRTALLRRVMMLGAFLCFGTAAVIAVWAAGLVAVWDTQWRLPYAACSALVLLAAAAWTLRQALSPGGAGPSTEVLQSELQKDMELFREWKNTL